MKTDLIAIAADLRRAFIDRPVPDGEPWPDVFDAVHQSIDRLGDAIPTLVTATNDLFDGLLPQGAAEPELNAGLASFRGAVAELIASYHDLWSRPFPPGLERGQVLLSAVFERPMRDYLSVLERILAALEECEEDIPEKLEFTLELRADEELARLDTWLQQTALAQRRELLRPKSFGLGALVVSFVLGWWIGGE